MLCPYCQKEMIKGHIINEKTDITWTPEGVKRSFWINGVNEGEVQLAKFKYLKSCKVEAYRCPDCKKIIING